MTRRRSRPRRTRALWSLLAISLVGVALGVLAFAPLGRPPTASEAGGLVGTEAPSLRGATLAGGSADLAVDGRGRLSWVNFWATSCEPCRTEMPAMQALAERYGDDLLILGVNWGESVDSVADFVARHGIGYPVVLDPTLETFYAWNRADGLPRHFFVDAGGTVVREVIGPLEPHEMVRIVEELMAVPASVVS